jgi:hypothetical protein
MHRSQVEFPDAKTSLLTEIFSLLICVGNSWRSDCSTSISCYEIGSQSPKLGKFLVKFPVSREFTWRRVRSAIAAIPDGLQEIVILLAVHFEIEAEIEHRFSTRHPRTA